MCNDGMCRNGKPGFGVCPHCKRWNTITDGHYLCRVCEGYEKPAGEEATNA